MISRSALEKHDATWEVDSICARWQADEAEQWMRQNLHNAALRSIHYSFTVQLNSQSAYSCSTVGC